MERTIRKHNILYRTSAADSGIHVSEVIQGVGTAPLCMEDHKSWVPYCPKFHASSEAMSHERMVLRVVWMRYQIPFLLRTEPVPHTTREYGEDSISKDSISLDLRLVAEVPPFSKLLGERVQRDPKCLALGVRMAAAALLPSDKLRSRQICHWSRRASHRSGGRSIRRISHGSDHRCSRELYWALVFRTPPECTKGSRDERPTASCIFRIWFYCYDFVFRAKNSSSGILSYRGPHFKSSYGTAVRSIPTLGHFRC